MRSCLCAEIPTITTRTRIVIVRHHLEQHRASNTGRLAHFALPNSELVDYPGGELALDNAWVLFTHGGETPVEPPKQLVVLDATWSQARRMFRKIGALRGLPILTLPDAPMPRARLRESPGPGFVSTIEAVARALRILEGDAVAAPLERLFDVAVARAAQSGRQMR